MHPPNGWLALAFFGVLGYLAAEVLQLNLAEAQQATHLSADILQADLPLAAAGAFALVFAGLVGSLWRANRAARAGGTGYAGATLGALGTVVLVLSGVGLPLALARIPSSVPAYLAGKGPVATLAGTFLALLGLALLCVGLVRAPLPSTGSRAQPRGLSRPGHAASQSDPVADILEGI